MSPFIGKVNETTGVGGVHDPKEGARMAPQPSDVTRLLSEASRATDLNEQKRLVAAAEEARSQIAATAAAEQQVDFASAVIRDHLTPVRVHEHHTAATDWLGDVPIPHSTNAEREMVAQGSVWYSKLHEAVKQHPDELAQQALGMAQRLAGQYGTGADAAEKAFLEHVGTLHARDVNAGLVSVVEAGKHSKPDEDDDEDDNWQPGGAPVSRYGEEGTGGAPVSYIDEHGNTRKRGSLDSNAGPGVQGEQVTMGLPGSMTTSDRAPAMRELSGNPRPGGNPELPQANPDVLNGDEGDRTDDTLRASAAYNERTAMPQQHTAACPVCTGCQACGGTRRVAVRGPRTAASGLDQIDQTVDSHDNPKPTPYPTMVAYPWEMPQDSSQAIGETEQQLAEREQRKGAALRAAKRAAEQTYLQYMGGQDDSGWLGDMGAGGVRPGYQDGGNPGNTFPGNLQDPDPVYGYGGDNGNQPLKPYGADEANDVTNNPGNWQPGQPTQADVAGRGNQIGQPTASRRSDDDPQIRRALAYVRQRRAELDG